MAEGRTGRPRKLSEEDEKQLRALALENPSLSYKALTEVFAKVTQIKVNYSTVRASLQRQGVTHSPATPKPKRPRPAQDQPRSDPPPPASAQSTPVQSKRYGYQSLHLPDPTQRRYLSSLTDAEWELVKDLFTNTGPGQPPAYERRLLLEACSYVVRSGCSWRMLPKEFPKWQNVYAHFRRWLAKGLFKKMNDRLRDMWRVREGRHVEPSAAILDSQSIKTGPEGGIKGYDAGKKVKGRKRHLVVDVLGLLLAVLIQPANIQDRDAASEIVQMAQADHPSIKLLIVDSAYSGQCKSHLESKCHIKVEVIKRPSKVKTYVDGQAVSESTPSGFIPLPKRWIVERTNAWNLRFRRLLVDHDRLLEVSAGWIWLAQSKLLLSRLSHSINT